MTGLERGNVVLFLWNGEAEGGLELVVGVERRDVLLRVETVDAQGRNASCMLGSFPADSIGGGGTRSVVVVAKSAGELSDVAGYLVREVRAW